MPKVDIPTPSKRAVSGSNPPNQQSGTVKIPVPNPSMEEATARGKQGRRRWRRDEIIDP